MTITAKFPGKCEVCGGKIRPGDRIEWKKGAGSRHEACATGAAAQQPTQAAARAPRKPSAPRAPKQIPAGVMLRSDKHAYHMGDVMPAILRDAEISECEERQAIKATEIPAADVAGKPLREGERRVGVVVIHTDRMSQESSDDNGYCGRYGATVRLATSDECAEIVTQRRAAHGPQICKRALEAALAYSAPGVESVGDTGTLPPAAETEVSIVLGRKHGSSGAIVDGGTTYALTATSIVAHHRGHYDDYRSSTRTIARTELLAQIIKAIAADDGPMLAVLGDAVMETRS